MIEYSALCKCGSTSASSVMGGPMRCNKCRAPISDKALAQPPLPQPLTDSEVAGFFGIDAGINPKDLCGARKPPLHLIPPSASIQESLVLHGGATKYGTWNWREKKISLMEYVGAIKRHLDQWVDGQDLDSESGLPHLAHARATTGIMIDAIECGCIVDDRPKPGQAAEMIRRYTKPAPATGSCLSAAAMIDEISD